MWTHSAFGRSRQQITTMPCKDCGKPVTAHRYCREVRIECPDCGAAFSLEQYVPQMDQALEDFLENVYCDRM